MRTARVRCVVKDNDENIIYLGGWDEGYRNRWRVSASQCIKHIQSGEWKYYVEEGGTKASIIIKHDKGRYALRTEQDGNKKNNLMNMRRCPD